MPHSTNRLVANMLKAMNQVCAHRLRLLAGVLVGSPLVLALHGQGTLEYRVTFDGPPYIAPGTSRLVDSYSERGKVFQPIGGADTENRLGRSGGGVAGLPENYSTYLVAPAFASLQVAALDGSSFGVVSVDLAEYSTLYDYPSTIPFVGFRSDGSIVQTSFTTDGIIDGTGPLADFETFYFDARFNDLVRLEVPTYGWALDNMVFSAVPEPTTLGLLCLGALAFIGAATRRVRR